MPTTITGSKATRDITGPNAASGAYAHSEGSGNVASGAYAHSEGSGNTASGTYAHVEGQVSTASGVYSHAEGGQCIASGSGSHAEGVSTWSSGDGAHAEGSSSNAFGYASHAEGAYAEAGRYAQHAQAGQRFSAAGDAQANTFTGSCSTTNSVGKLLTFDQSGSGVATLTGATTNVLTIPVNRCHTFRIMVVARRHDTPGDWAGWRFEGMVGRSSSGNAALAGSVDSRAWSSGAGSAAWDVTVGLSTADSTNNFLAITVTGESSKTIRWVARMDTVEVG